MSADLKNSAPIKGALFDMDGLLLDTERLYMASFNATVAQFDLPEMPEVAMRCIGLRADATAVIVTEALAGRVDYARFDMICRARFAQSLSQNIPLRPGAKALLQHLKSCGLPCALATSTHTEMALEHLQTTGLAEYFRHVIGGDQIKNAKPAPDIYHKAAQSLGLEAHECAAFEDSDPGATAAVRSGARTVQIPDIKQPSANTRALGHLIAPSLLEGAHKIGLFKDF